VLEAVDAVDITVPRTPEWTVQIKWMVEDGAEVSAGDKILEFDNSSFATTLEDNRNSIERARRTLEQQRAQAEVEQINARLELDSARIRLEKAELNAAIPEAILSRQEHQGYQLELVRARVAYDKAAENHSVAQQTAFTEARVQEELLSKTRRDVETAERAISDLVIAAPTNGVVVAADNPQEGRKFKVGDMPWVGLTVLRIPDFERMRVSALLIDVDDGLIEVGAPVVCTPDAHPDLQVSGHIVDIAAVAQEPRVYSMRRAFKVLVELDESDPERLRPGMSVKVEVELATVADSLLAPRAALDLASDPPRARTASGRWAEIRVGECSAQHCVIDEGLEEGERLARADGLHG
jgi:multidrug resistance efflux pump